MVNNPDLSDGNSAPDLEKEGRCNFCESGLDLQVVDHALYAVHLARDFFGFRFLLRRRHLAFELDHTVVESTVTACKVA